MFWLMVTRPPPRPPKGTGAPNAAMATHAQRGRGLARHLDRLAPGNPLQGLQFSALPRPRGDRLQSRLTRASQVDYLTARAITRPYNRCMFGRHELTCRRPDCGRPFSATRSMPGSAVARVAATNRPQRRQWRRRRRLWSRTTCAAGRRVPGGYVIPPPDPRNTFRADGWLR